MTITDRAGLIESLNADPFDVVSRSVLADWYEEAGDVIAAASHRETVKWLGEEERVMAWDHQFAKAIIRMDYKEFGRDTINQHTEIMWLRVWSIPDKYKGDSTYHGGWSATVEGGLTDKHLKPDEELSKFIVIYKREKEQLNPHVYIHPNLFAQSLIELGFTG